MGSSSKILKHCQNTLNTYTSQSDIWGRKPVLLIGLAGTGISMFIFGFAKNFQTILIARALGGLLNGNVGVLQTTVAEVVKAKEHQALAYSIMPFIWTLGKLSPGLFFPLMLADFNLQAPSSVLHLVGSLLILLRTTPIGSARELSGTPILTSSPMSSAQQLSALV